MDPEHGVWIFLSINFFGIGEGHKEISMENFNNLQIWQSNIPEAIEYAVKNNCLTESLVAMSPIGMVTKHSPYFWVNFFKVFQ